jgi:hypothetical protein
MDFKELRNLHEAYMDVYGQEEILDEVQIMRHQQLSADIDALRSANKGAVKRGKKPPFKLKNENPAQMERMRRDEKRPPSRLRSGKLPENYDLYDIIFSHLLDEGYAETPEAAEAIMVNMSEDWRESIVDELEQLDEISLKTKMKAYSASRDVDADYNYGSKVHDQGDRIKKAIVKKHGEKAGEHAERAAEVQNFGRGTPRAKPRIEKNRDYRTTKAGAMHGQDQAKLKSDLIKSRNKRNNA